MPSAISARQENLAKLALLLTALLVSTKSAEMTSAQSAPQVSIATIRQ